MARSFIEELRSFTDNEYHIVLSEGLARQIDQKAFGEQFTFYSIPYRPATKARTPWYNDKFLKQIELNVKPQVVFTTSGPAYFRSQAPHLMGFNLPHYIYPESPYFNLLSWRSRMLLWLKGKAIRHFYRRDADAIVGQTEDVTKRASQWLGIAKAFTVTNTISAFYTDAKVEEVTLPSRGEGEFRLLCFSRYYQHKNFEIINGIADLVDLVDGVRFVTTLPEDVFEEVFTLKAKEIVHNIGPVPVHLGPSLYKQCDALFAPSLLECFSANYVEAMATGTPVIAADLTFASSICRGAGVYFKPLSARDALNKIRQLRDDEKLRAQLIENGNSELMKFYSAKERAKKFLQISTGLLGA